MFFLWNCTERVAIPMSVLSKPLYLYDVTSTISMSSIVGVSLHNRPTTSTPIVLAPESTSRRVKRDQYNEMSHSASTSILSSSSVAVAVAVAVAPVSWIVTCRPGGETFLPCSSSGMDGRVGAEWSVTFDGGRAELLVVMDVGVTRASESLLAACG